MQGRDGRLRQREFRGRGRERLLSGADLPDTTEYFLGGKGGKNFSHVEKLEPLTWKVDKGLSLKTKAKKWLTGPRIFTELAWGA